MRKIGIGIGSTVIIVLTLFIFIGNSGNSQSADQDAGKMLENEDVGLSQEEIEKGLDLHENGANGTYVVNLLSGNFKGEVEGTVLTDTDCVADDEGISRCNNEIELDDQEKVTLIKPHNMQNYRCLSPGEKVLLSRNEKGKVIVQLLEV
ncbi:hypothetical protein ACDX78_18630 [Virgibacillus oceani]